MNKPQVTVKAVQTKNIQGKTLYYLKIERPDLEPYFVNIGEKTYNEVLKMENESPEPELPLIESKEFTEEGMSIPKIINTKDGKKG